MQPGHAYDANDFITVKNGDEDDGELHFMTVSIGKATPVTYIVAKFSKYKGQMELYLKYMQKYDMQEGENPPIGLLLCSEGNTEHIELMMLGEEQIKVAQYLTCLPDKQWFIDKLNRSILIAKENKI